MAEIVPSSNVLVMANGDTFTPNGKKIKIKGVRLVGNATDASSATLDDENSATIYGLACPIGECDESNICTNIDSTVLTANVTGTGSYLLVYLD